MLENDFMWRVPDCRELFLVHSIVENLLSCPVLARAILRFIIHESLLLRLWLLLILLPLQYVDYFPKVDAGHRQ